MRLSIYHIYDQVKPVHFIKYGRIKRCSDSTLPYTRTCMFTYLSCYKCRWLQMITIHAYLHLFLICPTGQTMIDKVIKIFGIQLF